MGLNRRLISTSAAFETDYSLTDSFGDGSGLAYWVNPASSLSSQGGVGYTISEDVGSLSSYSFSPGGGIALHYNNDRISVNGQINLAQSYTCSFWARINNSNAYGFYFYQKNGGQLHNDFFQITDSSGSRTMRVRHKFVTNDGDTFSFNQSDYTTYNSYYQHYGMVFDASASTYTYYINGSSVSTGDLDPKTKTHSNRHLMGTTFYNGSYTLYTCYMGDIRWYQRALTSDEYLAMAQYDGIP